MQRLGLESKALHEDALRKLQKMMSNAGIQPMPGRNTAARQAALRYQLLETMTAVMDTDVIVTMQSGSWCTNNQIVSTLHNLGENVQTVEVKSRMSATPETAKTGGKVGKPFAPTIKIRLKGGGGLNPGILKTIQTRLLAFTTNNR